MQVEKQTHPDPYVVIIALKYAFMLNEDDGVSLFDLKEVTLEGKWSGTLLPIEEGYSLHSEEEIVPV